MDSGMFPNGIAVSPDNSTLAIGDCTAGRMWYALFMTGPTMGCPQCKQDPLHLTFAGVKAGTYCPGNGCPDGIHYDVKCNLWAQMARLGGIIEIDTARHHRRLRADPERRRADEQLRVWRP